MKLGKEIANTWTFVRIFDQKELDDMEKQTGLHALDSGIVCFFLIFGLMRIVKYCEDMLEKKTYGNGTIYRWHLPSSRVTSAKLLYVHFSASDLSV